VPERGKCSGNRGDRGWREGGGESFQKGTVSKKKCKRGTQATGEGGTDKVETMRRDVQPFSTCRQSGDMGETKGSVKPVLQKKLVETTTRFGPNGENSVDSESRKR